MRKLTKEYNDFEKEIKKNKENYDKIIEEATNEIENFVQKANLENPVQ